MVSPFYSFNYMKKIFLYVPIGLLLVMMACQKELAEENLLFRGDWDSPHYALQIYQNGSGVCNSNKGLFSTTCDGRVSIKDNKIIFTSNKDHSTMYRKKFDIDQRPSIDQNGVTFMILDGERFVKH